MPLLFQSFPYLLTPEDTLCLEPPVAVYDTASTHAGKHASASGRPVLRLAASDRLEGEVEPV